jgi:hypothetical protein
LLLGGLLRTFHDYRSLRGREFVLTELLASIVINRRPHTYIHGKPLPRMALIHAANRSDVSVVPPIRDAYMLQTEWLAQRRIETHPA